MPARRDQVRPDEARDVAVPLLLEALRIAGMAEDGAGEVRAADRLARVAAARKRCVVERVTRVGQ